MLEQSQADRACPHNYHDTHQTFPPALLNSGRTNSARNHYPQGVKNTTGWVLLLPFIEQQPLHDAYDFNVCSSMSDPRTGLGPIGNDQANLKVYTARIPVYECPSSPTAGQQRTNRPGTTNIYSMRNARRTNYLFATGSFTDYDTPYHLHKGNRRLGMFGNQGAANFAGVSDGLSNTIAVGESVGGAGIKTSVNYGPWGLNGTHTCCHGRVVLNSNVNKMFDPGDPTNIIEKRWHINAVWYDTAKGTFDAQRRQYAWVFSSKHPGGAQFVFGDGSVRLLTQTMKYVTFGKLNYVQDAQAIDEEF